MFSLHPISQSLRGTAFVALAFFLFSASCSDQTEECLVTFNSCIDTCNGDPACGTLCGDNFKACAGIASEFPIHFCVVTQNDSATNKATLAQLREEVNILNTYFTAEDPSLSSGRRKMLHFTFKSATFYTQASVSGSPLVDLLDQEISYEGDSIQSLFNQESNASIRDPHALNIYVYDSWNSTDQRAHFGSHARNNNDRPYVLLDYVRLNHNIQAPEEHEMGHAFGLAHICEAGGVNIMGSGNKFPANGAIASEDVDYYEEDCPFGGGPRTEGFSQTQCAIILEHAAAISQELGLN